jgi:hypothetical protein
MENRTTKPEYAPFIIDVLKHLRVTNRDEILDEVFKAMKHRLHPDDFVVLANGEPRWRNQAQHMLDGLTEDGVVEEINGELRLSDS